MVKNRINFWNSIVSRFAFFFTGLMVFVILLSGYLVFRKSSEVIVGTAKERVRHSAELAERSFYALLNEVSNDIAVISSNLALRSFINNPGAEHAENLRQLFHSILKNKPDYFQIRLLDSTGQEMVRLDKTDTSIVQITDIRLQQKGDRDYFQEAIEIDQNEYYFSRINLNEEYGVISDPPIVTLRAASPLFNNHLVKCGLVIINVDMSRFYDELTRISASGIHFYLLDEEGQYLYTPNHDREFGIQRGNGHTFQTDYNQAPLTINEGNGEFIDKAGNRFLNYVRILNYFNAQRKVYLISIIDENVLLDGARNVRNNSLLNLALVCLAALFLSYLFSLLFSRQINLVTKAITRYEEGVDELNLPTNRRDEIGLLARSFATMRSKINQTLAELNTSLKEEKKAKAQRDEFLQNMSHELRTPLHTIQGLTQLLKKNKPNKAQVPIISSLERSVENLTGLVFDVLDHQQLIEGKLSIQLKSTNIAQVLEDVYGNYQFEAIKKGLNFNLTINPALKSHHYQTDPLRLSQIITNLIVNAIKYTEKGQIHLSADIQDDPSLLEIKIMDTGPGLDQENMLKINAGHFPEKAELSGRYGSYGLGLSIVRKLVTLLSGSMQVNSIKNQGTSFRILIPLPKDEQHIHMKPSLTTPNLHLPRLNQIKTILQIDDDLSNLELLAFVLRHQPFKLQQQQQFIEVADLQKQGPDLIISDLILGNRNIQEELELLIKTKQIPCPVIIVSAQDISHLRQMSPYCFQKPFDPELLVDQIYTLMGSDLYQQPKFDYLSINYDQNKIKINRALELIKDEFTTAIDRLELMENSRDLQEWQALSHKMITHIRSLDLTQLVPLLEDSGEVPSAVDLDFLSNSLKYGLCQIRLKIWLNSTG